MGQSQRANSDPFGWAYQQYFYGKPINIVKFSKVARRYMDEQQYKLLEQQCRITKNIAVSSQLLKRREKDHFREQAIHIGREVYYLFPCDAIPLKIFMRINPRNEMLIYQPPELG